MTDHPASFHFENEGDSTAGKLVRWDQGPSKYGNEPVPIAVLDTGAGEIGVWLFSSVLKAKLGDLRPKQGETVRVEYLGTKVSQGSGNPYKNWAVTCPDRETEEFTPDFAAWAGADASNPDWAED